MPNNGYSKRNHFEEGQKWFLRKSWPNPDYNLNFALKYQNFTFRKFCLQKVVEAEEFFIKKAVLDLICEDFDVLGKDLPTK